MIEHGVGVITTQVYELKERSNDFFDEDEGIVMASRQTAPSAPRRFLPADDCRRPGQGLA